MSDPHLPLLPSVPPASLHRLAGKRSLSYLALPRKPGRARAVAALAALAADVAAHRPDHIAVTGDLTNLALPGEFARARRWLARLGPPERVSAIPGNHDALVPVPPAQGWGLWAPWMGEGFPAVRRAGPLALVGLSSAVPTPPLFASGRLGEGQLARLGPLLAALGREGLFRVVLVHHPPVGGRGGRRRALRDAGALREVLRAHGAELVLHGHDHRATLLALPGPAGPIPVYGVPSASAPTARWHLHRVEPEGDGWRLHTLARGRDPANGRFAALGAWSLRLERHGGG